MEQHKINQLKHNLVQDKKNDSLDTVKTLIH